MSYAKSEGTPLGILRTEVINRDRQCVASIRDKAHECRDKWGDPHRPDALLKLTLEHVKDDRGRRLDSPDWCIALCSDANVNQHWSSANRDAALLYLAGVKAGQGRAP